MSETTISRMPRVMPSGVVRVVMRPMTRVLNPVIRRLAGRRFVTMAALVSHRGRRSGRIYRTPVGAHVLDAGCIIPLTFGTESDWCRNLRSSGEGTIRWKGRSYDLSHPRVLMTDEARPLVKAAFIAPFRLGFKILGITSFLYLRATPTNDT